MNNSEIISSNELLQLYGGTTLYIIKDPVAETSTVNVETPLNALLKNSKNLAIFFSVEENSAISQKLDTMLQNLTNAMGFSREEIHKIPITKPDAFSLEDFVEDYPADKVMTFGLPLQNVALYQFIKRDNFQIIAAESLAVLDADSSKKRKLWDLLLVHFNK